MPKKKRSERTERVEPKAAVLYVEVPPAIKERMATLANRHNRKLTGEVIQALQEYLTRYDLWPPKGGAS